MRWAATLLVVAVVGLHARRAAAVDQQAIDARAAEAPSVVLPILGVVMAGAGMYLNYEVAGRLADGDENCFDPGSGCYWGVVGAPLLALTGGALVAFYGWRLGEHHAWRDKRAGGEMKSTRGSALAGLLVGGAMVLTNLVIGQYILFKTLSCEASNAQMLSACFGEGLEKLALVQIGTNTVLLGAAPFVGYGFAYDSYRERHSGAQARLAPALFPGGGGLTVGGTF
jgi:hypothetical protein